MTFNDNNNDKLMNSNIKGDEDMVMIKEKKDGNQKEQISRQKLRKKLIRETINENRAVLEKLSRT